MNINNLSILEETLRRGIYKQGQDCLKTVNNKFCCLGVACDISGLGEWKGETNIPNIPMDYVTPNGDNDDTYLPPSVARYYGIEDTGYLNEPITVNGKIYATLADMNDKGLNFRQIADVIQMSLLYKVLENKELFQ